LLLIINIQPIPCAYILQVIESYTIEMPFINTTNMHPYSLWNFIRFWLIPLVPIKHGQWIYWQAEWGLMNKGLVSNLSHKLKKFFHLYNINKTLNSILHSLLTRF
jgi:hypothetical protein